MFCPSKLYLRAMNISMHDVVECCTISFCSVLMNKLFFNLVILSIQTIFVTNGKPEPVKFCIQRNLFRAQGHDILSYVNLDFCFIFQNVQIFRNSDNPQLFSICCSFDPNPYQRHSIFLLMIHGIMFALGTYGVTQSQIQRTFSTGTLQNAKKYVF